MLLLLSESQNIYKLSVVSILTTGGRSPIQMNDLVKDAIRFTDSMGMCGTDTLQILLTNTNVFDSRIVIKRLKDKGLDASAAI